MMKGVKAIQKLTELEAAAGTARPGASWHDEFRDSCFVYVGGLPLDLNEGDVVTVFSQYGEVIECNLVRDRTTGLSRGFAFVGYADQRSTVLAVDNFNGIKILGRTIKVDHARYRKPKKRKDGESQDESAIPPPPQPIQREKSDSVEGGEDEDDVRIDGGIKEAEEKMEKAERRLEKWKRRARKAKEAGEASKLDEAEREVSHIERVMRRLTRKQEESWKHADERAPKK